MANTDTIQRLQKFPEAQESFPFFKKQVTHKSCHKSTRHLGFHGTFRLAKQPLLSMTAKCRTSPRPNFCSALENHDCPSAPTQPSQWCGIFCRPSFYSKPQRQSVGRGCGSQLSWEPHHVFLPIGSYISSLTESLCGSLRQPLGNEVRLWGNLMDFVVCWVGRCFIIANGDFVSAKLSPFSSQANIKDLRGICSKVF